MPPPTHHVHTLCTRCVHPMPTAHQVPQAHVAAVRGALTTQVRLSADGGALAQESPAGVLNSQLLRKHIMSPYTVHHTVCNVEPHALPRSPPAGGQRRGGRRTQGWHLQVDPSSRTVERCHTPCAHTVYPYCIDTPTQAPPRYLPAGWSCRLRVVYPGMAACRCGGCTQDTACRWPQSQWIQLSSIEDPIRVMATDTPRRGRTWKRAAPCHEKRGER